MAFSSILRSSPLVAPAAAPCSRRPRSVGRSFNHVASVLRVSSIKRRTLSVRCEQSANKGGGVDVWAGRLAMVGFAAAVVTEASTGKGLVENFGLATPAPGLALVVTALVAGLAVLFIVQSGSQD